MQVEIFHKLDIKTMEESIFPIYTTFKCQSEKNNTKVNHCGAITGLNSNMIHLKQNSISHAFNSNVRSKIRNKNATQH